MVAAGLFLAWLIYRSKPEPEDETEPEATPTVHPAHRFLRSGWGFDWLYDHLLERPLAWLARINKNDVVDLPFRGVARAANAGHAVLARTQTGRLRWYAAALAIGAAVVILVAVFL